MSIELQELSSPAQCSDDNRAECLIVGRYICPELCLDGNGASLDENWYYLKKQK